MDDQAVTTTTQASAPQRRANWAILCLVALLLLSLALQLWTYLALQRVRTITKAQLVLLTAELHNAQRESIRFDVPIQHSVPFSTSIPVREQIIVPISTTVSLSETVPIPIVTPFGTTSFDVPVRMDVPVRTDVPVTLDERFVVDTTVDLDFTVPLEVELSETPLASYLRRLERALEQLDVDL